MQRRHQVLRAYCPNIYCDQRKTFREPPYPSRDSPDIPRSPTKEELKIRG
jgi:hypothetical protein